MYGCAEACFSEHASKYPEIGERAIRLIMY